MGSSEVVACAPDSAKLVQAVPYPADDANKYSRGKAVVCAGSEAYPGAALLAAQATQLVGAGYTEVYTDSSNVAKLQIARASLVVRPFSAFDADKAASVNHPAAFLVGCGMDRLDQAAIKVFAQAASQASHPLVADGGALLFVADQPAWAIALLASRASRGQASILTPHAGEAARLAGAAQISLSGNAAADARALADCFHAVVVLKGPDTCIARPGSVDVVLVEGGTSALAKAGTGDVLAGVVGGLAAQGVPAWDAAVLGVELHARAGKEAERRVGRISVCAEDVLACLPAALAGFAQGEQTGA